MLNNHLFINLSFQSKFSNIFTFAIMVEQENLLDFCGKKRDDFIKLYLDLFQGSASSVDD